MSNLSDLPLLLANGSQLLQGHVQALPDTGQIDVRFAGMARVVPCRVLQTSGSALSLAAGDEVLVWLGDADAGGGVVLGCIGSHDDVARPVVAAAEFAARPQSLVIETQGDLVLRNG